MRPLRLTLWGQINLRQIQPPQQFREEQPDRPPIEVPEGMDRQKAPLRKVKAKGLSDYSEGLERSANPGSGSIWASPARILSSVTG